MQTVLERVRAAQLLTWESLILARKCSTEVESLGDSSLDGGESSRGIALLLRQEDRVIQRDRLAKRQNCSVVALVSCIKD